MKNFMQISFENQNILITGGTKGIGKKLVQEFTKLGGKVWFTGRDKNIEGDRYFYVDFNKKNQMDVFLEKISKINFSVLVNNAGTNKIGNIEKYPVIDYEEIINLNLTSCFKVIKSVVPNMIKNNYGKVINITSISSQISMPLRSAYCSSKFGLLGLTKASAVELAKHNILINAIGPGVTETELTVNVLGKKKMDEIANNIPIGRLANTEDISKVVMFMSSKLNSYIVGQNIIIDGGYTCV